MVGLDGDAGVVPGSGRDDLVGVGRHVQRQVVGPDNVVDASQQDDVVLQQPRRARQQPSTMVFDAVHTCVFGLVDGHRGRVGARVVGRLRRHGVLHPDDNVVGGQVRVRFKDDRRLHARLEDAALAFQERQVGGRRGRWWRGRR